MNGFCSLLGDDEKMSCCLLPKFENPLIGY
jgi:hypothetical protein